MVTDEERLRILIRAKGIAQDTLLNIADVATPGMIQTQIDHCYDLGEQIRELKEKIYNNG